MVVLAKFLRKKRCPLSPNLRAAFSIPHRNFWACFIAFGVAKERDGERERGKEKHRKEEREKAEWILPSLLSLPSLSLLSPLFSLSSPPSSQTVIDDLSPNGVRAFLPPSGFIANRWMGARHHAGLVPPPSWR